MILSLSVLADIYLLFAFRKVLSPSMASRSKSIVRCACPLVALFQDMESLTDEMTNGDTGRKIQSIDNIGSLAKKLAS